MTTLKTAKELIETGHEYLISSFIRNGYRSNLTFLQGLQSIFELHNETVQIWTHLLPAILFWYKARKFHQSSEHDDKTFVIYCVSMALVFSASAFAHTFNAVEGWFYLSWKLDWSAVGFAISGVNIAISRIAFYGKPDKQSRWSGIFLLQFLLYATGTTTPLFAPLPTSIKAMIGVGIPFIPVLAHLFTIGNAVTVEQLEVAKTALYGPIIILILGVLAYGFEFPERQFQDYNFDVTRGHHLIHHTWSTIFGIWLLYGLQKWQLQMKAAFKDDKMVS